jgi:hypothetical protein
VSHVRFPKFALPAICAALIAAQASPAAADEPAPFPGFTAVDSYAQGQVATGYLYAVGDEESRLVGANAQLNGPPAGSQAIAAFFQRGEGGTYVYDFLGGGQPGKPGKLPDPPPGEAAGYFPASPGEATFAGPISSAGGQAADGRFHAKATSTPSSIAEAAITNYNAAGQFILEWAHITSHTEPAEGGVRATSTSVLHGITIGPLRIDNLTSTATGLITPKDKAKGIANTVVTGATVNGTPVQITDQGVVVAGAPTPGAQQQVNDAFAASGYKGVALVPAMVQTQKDGTFQALTAGMRMVYRNDDLGANNPQGFAGGGFQFGGAEVRLLGHASDAGFGAPPVAPPSGVSTRTLSRLQNAAWTAPLDGVHTGPTLVPGSGNREMTPKVATDLRHGYLAFGAALICLSFLALLRLRLVRRRLSVRRMRSRS